jgi:hypothetical protein
MDFMSFLAAFLAVVSAGVFAAHILDALRSCAIVTAQPLSPTIIRRSAETA